ncbi:MAG: hypothetical protein ACK5NT_15940 [Pyrinomonadaceae bacterium]
MTAQDHGKMLSIFFYIHAAFSVFGGVMVLIMYGFISVFFAAVPGNDRGALIASGVFLVLGIVIAVLLIALSAFYFITARRVGKFEHSGRILGIVASCLCLLSFPLGTALGIYGLWFLSSAEGRTLYDSGAQQYR